MLRFIYYYIVGLSFVLGLILLMLIFSCELLFIRKYTLVLQFLQYIWTTFVGQIFGLYILVMAAIETALALSLILALFKLNRDMFLPQLKYKLMSAGLFCTIHYRRHCDLKPYTVTILLTVMIYWIKSWIKVYLTFMIIVHTCGEVFQHTKNPWLIKIGEWCAQFFMRSLGMIFSIITFEFILSRFKRR